MVRISERQGRETAQQRRELLIRLVRAGTARTQHDLQRAFARKGVRVTQSSLSRDIAQLGLIKRRGAYALPGEGEAHPLPPIMAIDSAGSNLLVLKTLPGMAASVAVAIDERRLPHVVGTVAGDDTVFVATAIGTQQARVAKALRSVFPRRTT